jgi:hypothetical protein
LYKVELSGARRKEVKGRIKLPKAFTCVSD